MKKKTILNGLMVLIIVLIAVCAFMAVKTLKGPSESNAQLSIASKTGIVTVERNGIAYEIDEDDVIRIGDRLRSKKGAKLSLTDGEATFVLGANSEMEVEEDGVYLHIGELFVDGHAVKKSMMLRAKETVLEAKNAVFTVSAQKGAQTVYVYAGEAIVENENVKAGQKMSAVEKNDETTETEVTSFTASALNDMQIELLQTCEIDSSFCVSTQELTEVVTVRQEEKMKAQQAQLLLAEESKEALEKEQKEYEKALADSKKTQTSNAVSDTTTGEVAAAPSMEETFTTSDYTGGSSDYDDTKYVTIEIRCDTILDNMENLTAGKDVYVPGSGTILSTSKVEFEDGETVFEVLKRACSRAGIQMEYRWTPMYESYYIEGINHLYEFDCGNESGWMYKVNGWFPNYGCSSYVLEDGDVIVWCYTCNGLGRDLGFEGF